MTYEIGGWLWLFIDVILVVALAGGLIYGTMQWRRWKKRPPVDPAERDAATKEAYRS